MGSQRYWFHHPTLSQVVGPYTRDELRDAVTGGSFPVDGKVREDGVEDAEWQQIADLLGLAIPPSSSPASGIEAVERAAAPPDPQRNAEADLEDARARTAYGGFRRLVTIVATVKIVLITIAMIFSVIGFGPALRNSGFAATTVLISIGGSAVEILIVVVAAKLLNIVADIADGALQRRAAP
ncbi:MAG: hypothetical protein KDE27_28010 [Planctomycetes bacterium]|nr:hypothetical protein [Planctomycetota bacterium]